MDFSTFSDAKLYQICKMYGENARNWMRKFAGLLPEVYRRKLYVRRDFGSIHEFAAKLAGMTERAVDKILRLSERLSDKPKLLEQLQNGSHGWTKLETVAYIATSETDSFWADKVQNLPQQSLQIFVAEQRKIASEITVNGQAEHGGETTQDPWNHLSFPVSPDVEKKLRHLKQKLEKEKRETLTWNHVMMFFLDEKAGAPSEPLRTIQICPDCTLRKIPEKCSRYIPATVRHLILAQYGIICVFPKCREPYKHLHHTKRFSLTQNHDPKFIVPVCEKHHQFLHTGLVQNEEMDPVMWTIREQPDTMNLKYFVDERYKTYYAI